MKLVIFVCHPFGLWNAPAWFPDRLRQEFPQLDVVHLSDYERVDDEIVEAEIAITWSLRPEQIRTAKKLRWIHSPAAAVHQLIFPELVESDIVLTNAREVHGAVVAEHVIALIFALAKKIPDAVLSQQKHEWGQQKIWDEFPRVREVAGATVGLVGLGSIGRAVAKSAKALGMRVNIRRRELKPRTLSSGLRKWTRSSGRPTMSC
jgi:phosphoglycerate dehydrogenase-like enzyme